MRITERNATYMRVTEPMLEILEDALLRRKELLPAVPRPEVLDEILAEIRERRSKIEYVDLDDPGAFD